MGFFLFSDSLVLPPFVPELDASPLLGAVDFGGEHGGGASGVSDCLGGRPSGEGPGRPRLSGKRSGRPCGLSSKLAGVAALRRGGDLGRGPDDGAPGVRGGLGGRLGGGALPGELGGGSLPGGPVGGGAPGLPGGGAALPGGSVGGALPGGLGDGSLPGGPVGGGAPVLPGGGTALPGGSVGGALPGGLGDGSLPGGPLGGGASGLPSGGALPRELGGAAQLPGGSVGGGALPG